MSQSMCSLVFLLLFVLLLYAAFNSLGSAGLGHRIVFLACILVFVFTPIIFCCIFCTLL